MIETILIIIGILLMIAGILGSFLPIIPGLPFSYAGLLVLQMTSSHPFSLQFFIIWGLIVVVLMVLDNVIPAYGTKKFGGSAYGVWGSILGLVVGFFFPPMGLIIGPLVGAFLGELLAGKKSGQAFRSAIGSFMGFVAGTILKVIASGMMAYYFIINI